MSPAQSFPRGTKVALISDFPPGYMDRDIKPWLRARGCDIVLETKIGNATKYDLKSYGVELVLYMHEYSNHADSKQWSWQCGVQGIPIRALSRKRSSWGFLPEPIVPTEPEEIAVQPKIEPVPVQPRSPMPTTATVVPLASVPALTPKPPSDDVTITTLYQEEIDRLRAEVETLKSRSIDRVLPAIQTLIQAGFMTTEEALLQLLGRSS